MTCPVCRCVFCPDDQDEPPGPNQNRKLYCSATCKTRAKRRRGEVRALRQSRIEFYRQRAIAARCEAQGKKRYGSRKDALVELRRINTIAGLGLHSAYPCGDHWHLTRQRAA